jgi:hypothetical protein
VKPWESSYACFANNPIWYSDVNGDDGTQTSSGNGYMTGDLNNVVVRSSKLDPDKKDDKDDKEDDGKKSSGGGGGGGGAGGAGAGPNNKNSVGADQLKKYSPLLQSQGFGIADNGGGNGGEGGFAGSGGSGNVNWDAVNLGLKVADFIGVGAAAGREIALDYRMSQPLMNRVGMSTNLKAILGLGTASKYLGWAGNAGAVLSTGLDYNQYKNGQLSGARFGYNTIGTAASVGVGYFNPVAGAAVGGSFYIGQQMYDGYNWWVGQMSIYLTNFENGLKNGWVPGR